MEGLEQFSDWELLHNSDSEAVLIDSSPVPVNPHSESSDSSSESLEVSSTPQEVVGSPEFDEFEEKQGSESEGSVGSYGVLQDEIRGLEENQDVGFEDEVKSDVGFEGISETQGIGVGSGGEVVERVESSRGDGSGEIQGDEEEVKEDVEEKREMVWWKVPFEILKFCVFRVNPVWSLSVAAAILGFVILRKRLNRMKRKSRNIPITLAVGEKKASQLKVHAARLNEAFSVVRSVPIVRARLLPSGVTPWPTLNLR